MPDTNSADKTRAIAAVLIAVAWLIATASVLTLLTILHVNGYVRFAVAVGLIAGFAAAILLIIDVIRGGLHSN